MTVRERRIQRLWKALAGDHLAGLVVAGKGLIGQYGTLEWCAGYVPVVRGAYAVLTPDAEPEKGFYYRSDHFNFAKVGVPALDTDDGIDYIGKPPGFGKAKKDDYTANDYHSPSDEVKPDWDMTGFAEEAKLLMAVGYRIAQAEKFPEWKPGNEFKAIRDKMIKK